MTLLLRTLKSEDRSNNLGDIREGDRTSGQRAARRVDDVVAVAVGGITCWKGGREEKENLLHFPPITDGYSLLA